MALWGGGNLSDFAKRRAFRKGVCTNFRSVSMSSSAAMAAASVPGGNPVPPPNPPRPKPERAGDYEPINEKSEAPWGIEGELLETLYLRAETYAAYTKRFTCNETARLANYDKSGGVNNEKTRRYGYLLITPESGEGVYEIRQEFAPCRDSASLLGDLLIRNTERQSVTGLEDEISPHLLRQA